MGITQSATMTCDNCDTANTAIDSPSSVPEGWMRATGSVVLPSGSQTTFQGFFCPDCITSQGTKALAKKAADLCDTLT